MSAQPRPLPAEGPIVDSRKSSPPKSPGKRGFRRQVRAKFADAAHWEDMAGRCLARYDLPAWTEPPSEPAFGLWLERMELPLRTFLRTGAYRNFDEAVALNPAWPLRAWIGLALETKHDEVAHAAH